MAWKFEWVEGEERTVGSFAGSGQLGSGFRACSVFQEPIVIEAWLKSKGAALGVVPKFCLAHGEDGEAVFIPFCWHRGRWGNAGRRRLTGAGEPHFDFQDPVVASKRSEASPGSAFWTQLEEELARHGQCEEALLLRLNVPPAMETFDRDSAVEAPYLTLSRFSSLQDVLEWCPAKHRNDVRRQMRRFADAGAVRLHVFDPDQNEAAHAEMRALKQAHSILWHGTPSGGLFESPGTYAFYERLIDHALPAGLVHFSVLFLNEQPVSWHFGFLDNGVFHWYKPTYNQAFQHLSPGKVHLAYLIELGIRENWVEINFGGGSEQYKRHWAEAARPLFKWQWLAPTWRRRITGVLRQFALPGRNLYRRVQRTPRL